MVGRCLDLGQAVTCLAGLRGRGRSRGARRGPAPWDRGLSVPKRPCLGGWKLPEGSWEFAWSKKISAGSPRGDFNLCFLRK